MAEMVPEHTKQTRSNMEISTGYLLDPQMYGEGGGLHSVSTLKTTKMTLEKLCILSKLYFLSRKMDMCAPPQRIFYED